MQIRTLVITRKLKFKINFVVRRIQEEIFSKKFLRGNFATRVRASHLEKMLWFDIRQNKLGSEAYSFYCEVFSF